MTNPEVVRCSDGHFRRAIYGLGPYIADYPEQALLTCVVQGWCTRYVFAPFVAHVCLTIVISRCTAKRTDLDGEAGRRSHDHTELLVNTFELGTLWDEYGLVGDVVVCFIPLFISFLVTK